MIVAGGLGPLIERSCEEQWKGSSSSDSSGQSSSSSSGGQPSSRRPSEANYVNVSDWKKGEGL